MNELLNLLLGLDSVRLGEGGAELEFVRPIPAWGWALITLGAISLAAWSYRRLDGPAWARVLLAGSRALVIICLTLLASGPRLVKPRERTELDWLVVLVDRSASMTIADATGGAGERITRDAQLRDALQLAEPEWRSMAAQRNILWLGFGESADALGVFRPAQGDDDQAPRPIIPTLGEPDRQGTMIAPAITDALRRTAGARLSGIVLLTDGRSPLAPGPELLTTLSDARVRVATVPLGTPGAVGDLAVTSINSPPEAFVGDVIPVVAQIERRGDGAEAMTGSAQLIDLETGATLATSTLEEDMASLEFVVRVEPESLYGITLAAPPPDVEAIAIIERVRENSPADDAGVTPGDRLLALRDIGPMSLAMLRRALSEIPEGQTVTLSIAREGERRDIEIVAPSKRVDRRWVVRLDPDGIDLSADNNERPLGITLIDRPLRVLHLDGYPRWEYRYVKNLLIREPTIESSSLMLAAGRAYLAEGNTPLDAPPTTPEDWSAFDVVIMGDVRSGALGPRQIQYLRELVAIRGAGLLWIAGESATPWAWADTDLADLLPFSLTSEPVRPRAGDSVLAPTALASTRNLLIVGDVVTEADLGWSRLRYAQRIPAQSIKPTAEILAMARAADPDASSEDASPAILTMRYGAGRVIYIATDEIWRWRYGQGEELPERLYIPLVRSLGADSLGRGGRRATLSVNPGEVTVGQEAAFALTLLEQELASRPPEGAALLIRRWGETIEQAVRVPLEMGSDSGDPFSVRVAQMTASWSPRAPGRYIASPTGGPLGELGLEVTLEAIAPDDELRRPEADHELLAGLASSLGELGMVVAPDDLREIPELIPPRPTRIELRPEIVTLWDRPAPLIFLLTLLGLEWAGRRLISLS